MNIFELENKIVFRLVALFCGGLLLFALILQYFVSLTPCPLCIVQRFFYFLIGVTALSASFGWIKGIPVWMYGFAITILALLGGLIAFRQVWLQQHPTLADPTICVVPFGSFLNSVILSLGGTGNCGIRDWTLFSLSIADWSLLCFVFLLSVVIFLVIRESKQENMGV